MISVTTTSGRIWSFGHEERFPITDGGDHFEFGLEQAAQLFGDPGVILGQQNTRSIHARL